MGTYYKTPRERFEDRWKNQNSVECCIIIEMKPRKSWENGLTIDEIKKSIEQRRKRIFCKGRIYEAISLINRYGKEKGVYLRSSFGYVIDENNNKHCQHRYFIPTDSFDVQKEKSDLEHKRDIIGLKQEHLQFHEEITIPSENELNKIFI